MAFVVSWRQNCWGSVCFWWPEFTLSQVQVEKRCSSSLFQQCFPVLYKKMYISNVGLFMRNCKILLLVSTLKPFSGTFQGTHTLFQKPSFLLIFILHVCSKSSKTWLTEHCLFFPQPLTCHFTIGTIFTLCLSFSTHWMRAVMLSSFAQPS